MCDSSLIRTTAALTMIGTHYKVPTTQIYSDLQPVYLDQIIQYFNKRQLEILGT